jgi:hypothetical protein
MPSKREQMRAKNQRRKRMTTLAAIAAGLAVVAIIGYVVWQNSQPKTEATAIDVGETVLVEDEGNSARQILGDPKAPVRSLIVAIVDSVDVPEQV